VANDLSKATWLKIALLNTGNQLHLLADKPVFNAETIKYLPPSAYVGLRRDHVPLIAAADFALFNRSQTVYFANDTVSAFTGEQLAEIEPTAFSLISPFAMSGLNPQAISSITEQQVLELRTSQISALNCMQLQGFSMDQLSKFNNQQKVAYDNMVCLTKFTN